MHISRAGMSITCNYFGRTDVAITAAVIWLLFREIMGRIRVQWVFMLSTRKTIAAEEEGILHPYDVSE